MKTGSNLPERKRVIYPGLNNWKNGMAFSKFLDK
jgi:hypothetical protein